jgi:hypothetical protein
MSEMSLLIYFIESIYETIQFYSAIYDVRDVVVVYPNYLRNNVIDVDGIMLVDSFLAPLSDTTNLIIGM